MRPILQLQVLLKGRQLKRQRFERDTVQIGRHPKSDIVLDNPSVSWAHAMIERVSHLSFRLRDLGSANGTYLNEARVEAAFLRDGDLIQVGKFTILVNFDEDRRQHDGPFSQQTTDVTLEPVDSTFALTTGEIRDLMATAATLPPAESPPAIHVVQPPPQAPQPRPRAWSRYLVHILEQERGPLLLAFAVGLLLGFGLGRCV